MGIKNESKKIKVYVGFTITSKHSGCGKCTKIDYTSKRFRYFFKFEDGTVKWMSDQDIDNMMHGIEPDPITTNPDMPEVV